VPETPSLLDTTKPSLLLACRDKTEQDRIHSLLLDAGYRNVMLAENARKVLHYLNTQTVDLLITDLELPGMDGWRLSRLIRSGILNCKAQLPILMIAHTWCERIAEVTAREYGIDKLLPASATDKLITVIESLINPLINLNSKPRLLVIEDSEDTAHLVERVLSNLFDIELAHDGKQGLLAWMQRRHHLVLLDIMLPSLSGREILGEILRQHPGQPIVVMTAHANAEEAEDLMFLGATDFLPKPFRAEQLRKVCDIAIHRDDYLVSTEQFANQVQSLKESEQAFRNLYQSHHQLLNDLQSVVMELDEQLNIRFINPVWQKLTGFSQEQTLNKPLINFIARGYEDLFHKLEAEIILFKQTRMPIIDFELGLQSRSGHLIWMQLKLNSSQQNTRYSLCLDDITEQRKSQEQLNFLATHDSLTGLFNRHYAELLLKEIFAETKAGKKQHALVYIDLDHFKIINDTFGHQKGDQVLKEMSQLLLKKIRKTDVLCRLGGDEFAVFLNNITPQKTLQIAQAVQKIISDFSFFVHEQRMNMGCSIGVALIDGTAQQADEYFMRADIALYVAKGRGRNLIHFYNPCDNESAELKNRINISQKIRTAIREDRMVLFFQPIFDIQKNQISHFEALVRLREKDGAIVGPAEFIPVLEAAGEMYLLDRWVIKLATRALKDHPELTNIAINLSAQAFKDDNLVPNIIENLGITQVNPNRITFELTESASLFNLQMTQSVIKQLHQLGCSFSVDDFGSGFSSFAYLKSLPADYIKVDGSFIKNLDQDPVDQALVKSMVQVIQAIGKKAIAEYVENEAILQLLVKIGIDYVQGYHIGHPQPIEDAIKYFLESKIQSGPNSA
jgi:diguanylate cyclase (GGDEF)-like protein/PAS domain S-box-containing protein